MSDYASQRVGAPSVRIINPAGLFYNKIQALEQLLEFSSLNERTSISAHQIYEKLNQLNELQFTMDDVNDPLEVLECMNSLVRIFDRTQVMSIMIEEALERPLKHCIHIFDDFLCEKAQSERIDIPRELRLLQTTFPAPIRHFLEASIQLAEAGSPQHHLFERRMSTDEVSPLTVPTQALKRRRSPSTTSDSDEKTSNSKDKENIEPPNKRARRAAITAQGLPDDSDPFAPIEYDSQGNSLARVAGPASGLPPPSWHFQRRRNDRIRIRSSTGGSTPESPPASTRTRPILRNMESQRAASVSSNETEILPVSLARASQSLGQITNPAPIDIWEDAPAYTGTELDDTFPPFPTLGYEPGLLNPHNALWSLPGVQGDQAGRPALAHLRALPNEAVQIRSPRVQVEQSPEYAPSSSGYEGFSPRESTPPIPQDTQGGRPVLAPLGIRPDEAGQPPIPDTQRVQPPAYAHLFREDVVKNEGMSTMGLASPERQSSAQGAYESDESIFGEDMITLKNPWESLTYQAPAPREPKRSRKSRSPSSSTHVQTSRVHKPWSPNGRGNGLAGRHSPSRTTRQGLSSPIRLRGSRSPVTTYGLPPSSARQNNSDTKSKTLSNHRKSSSQPRSPIDPQLRDIHPKSEPSSPTIRGTENTQNNDNTEQDLKTFLKEELSKMCGAIQTLTEAMGPRNLNGCLGKF